MKILSMLPAGDLPPLDGVPSLGRLHFSYIPLNKKGYFGVVHPAGEQDSRARRRRP
jgi:hypothetical protein